MFSLQHDLKLDIIKRDVSKYIDALPASDFIQNLMHPFSKVQKNNYLNICYSIIDVYKNGHFYSTNKYKFGIKVCAPDNFILDNEPSTEMATS